MAAAADPAPAPFPPAAVRAALDRVTKSPHFARSQRLTEFLRFTVEARLAGRAHELKERTIAAEVYGRRIDYDPRLDPIVRSEAHRLRAKLGAYYASEGANDPIAIEVPKGSYLPEFRRHREAADAPLRAGAAAAPAHARSPRAYEEFVKAHHGVMQFANTRQRELVAPARRRLLRALELEPSFPDALADLAFLELLQLNPPSAPPERLIERARAHLERALASDPRHVRSLCLLGDVHGASGRAREALDLTETAMALDPGDAEARTFLALRWACLGFYEAAVASCDAAIRLDPVWEVAQQAKALYAGLAGAPEAGIAALEAHHRAAVPNAVSEVVLGGLCVAAGDLGGAEAAVARAVRRLSPQQDASHVEILGGLVAAARGDAATALRVLDAHRSSPPRILDHLIRLALALGDGDAALRQLRASPYHRNYRWLAREPLARPWLGAPGFRVLLAELHESWRRDVAELAARLPAPPPPLPGPEGIAGA